MFTQESGKVIQIIIMKETKKWRAAVIRLLFWAAVLGFLLVQKDLILDSEAEDILTPLVSGEVIFRTLLIILAVVSGISMYRGTCISGYREKKKKRMGIWCHLFLLTNAVYAFLALEFLNNPVLLEMEIPYMLLNIAGIMIISLILLLWLNSFRRTMILILLLYTAASFLFSYVYACRGEPLQFIDVFAVGTAMEVAGGYHFELTRAAVIVLVLSFSLLGFYLHLPDWQLAKGKRGKIGIRIGVIAGMIAGYYLYLNTNWNGELGILTDLWAPIKTYKEYGTQVGFFSVAKYMRLSAPEEYSTDTTEEIAEKYKELLGPSEETDSGKTVPVNIIAIMNESWADYRQLGELKTTEPVMPFYDSMEENTIKGNTMVCIRGGGTAKTEYEFLTGNSEKRFPGMVPYVSYYTHEQHSLFEVMKQNGYQVAAMHPNKGTNWNRSNAYRLMGVEDFYTIEDFPADAGRIRAHISDHSNYEEIIRLIENKEDPNQPFFLFDVTMQNHGGYKAKKYQSRLSVDGYEDSVVDQYLSLLRDSDDALRYLIEYFSQCSEPAMILMFGDHFPDLPETFTEYLTGKKFDDSSLEEQQKYYSTPFFIWTNYDIEEVSGIQTSTNYLGSMLLENAGLNMPLYNRYLLNLQESMPALNHLGYMDPDGNWTAWDAAGEKEEQLEWEYECLQYNNLAENRKRLDWFFALE